MGGDPGTVDYIFTESEFFPHNAKWVNNIGIDT